MTLSAVDILSFLRVFLRVLVRTQEPCMRLEVDVKLKANFGVKPDTHSLAVSVPGEDTA